MALEVVLNNLKFITYLDILFMNFLKRFRVVLDRPVWAPVGKDPLCTGGKEIRKEKVFKKDKE